MPNTAKFHTSTDYAEVSGTLTDNQMVIPVEPPTGLKSIGPRVTFHFIEDEWDSGNTYRYYDVVQVGGASYVAIRDVPAGTEITNGEYWFLWAEPNTQIEDLKDIVGGFDARIEEAVSAADRAESQVSAATEAAERAAAEAESATAAAQQATEKAESAQSAAEAAASKADAAQSAADAAQSAADTAQEQVQSAMEAAEAAREVTDKIYVYENYTTSQTYGTLQLMYKKVLDVAQEDSSTFNNYITNFYFVIDMFQDASVNFQIDLKEVLGEDYVDTTRTSDFPHFTVTNADEEPVNITASISANYGYLNIVSDGDLAANVRYTSGYYMMMNSKVAN